MKGLKHESTIMTPGTLTSFIGVPKRDIKDRDGKVAYKKGEETEYDQDWSWQGKRPDQVSKSYKIATFCIFVLFVLGKIGCMIN